MDTPAPTAHPSPMPAPNPVLQALAQAGTATWHGLRGGAAWLHTQRRWLLTAGAACASAWLLVQHPPLQQVHIGDRAVRTNQLTGDMSVLPEGPALALPLLHALRHFPLRDRVVRATAGAKATGPAPYQSVEGLSLGVEVTLRYALDPTKLTHITRHLPEDLDRELVAPALQTVCTKTFARHTVREIFSSQRTAIQQAIEAELKTRLAADGIVLKSVQIGQVDLPADYRRGMDALLAEELAAEKMRYTLELKEKLVQQTALEAQADKARRETAAAAAAAEQVIAAKAQEEAMRHVLPFKQKQIEQRQLEAEAEKGARIKQAEASGAARRIEAAAEAESRQKLADAEAYRMDRVGKVASEQMAREGALLTRHPLLIQKTVADKLSDKVQVIIAPPGTDGRFIASGLVGRLPDGQAADGAEQGVQ